MTKDRQTRPPEPARVKKPWIRPRITSGSLFESNSLQCGKSNPGTGACLAGPLSS